MFFLAYVFVYDLFCSGSEAAWAFRPPLERSCTSKIFRSYNSLKVAKILSYLELQNKSYTLLANVIYSRF